MLCGALSDNDLRTIRGLTRKEAPTGDAIVAGYEGVGVVAYPGNSTFSRGDWVVPAKPGFGMW
jgi:hypothetical protein